MNYRKEDLENKVKKDLIKIAEDLNLDTSGNKTALIGRIFKHKPSFKEMIETAPVSKDGDLNISIEEDIPVGVDVNDAYPDQNEENEAKEKTEIEKETEVETEVTEEDDGKELIPEFKTEPEQETEVETEEGMVPENTAEDILKGWQSTIQNFYRKNVPGIAPARPAQVTAIAEKLGIPSAAGVLSAWQAAIISRLRPVRGVAPAPPKTAKDIIQIIKSL
jgi:hypothetical protein